MGKKTSLLYISLLLCLLFIFAACTVAGEESGPPQMGFVKKEGIVGIYDADKTSQSALVAKLIASKLEESGHQAQIYEQLADLPQTGLSALCVCTKDGKAMQGAVESKLSNKVKILYVGDSAIENGIGVTSEAVGIAAVEAIRSDMLERKQTPGRLLMVAQDVLSKRDVQEGFIKQANQYGYTVEEKCFAVEETFYALLKEQAAEKPVGVVALDAASAAEIAQFSIENRLTDNICIVVLGADEEVYTYLRLCAISGILVEDPYALAEAALKTIADVADGSLVKPLLLTRKNVDMPEYRDL